MNRRTLARLALAAVAASALSAPAFAWPDRPIKFIVTFAPGGASDIVARALAEPLGRKLGQPVVVENRPGAGGSVGGVAVATAAPDGYTFMLSNSTPLSVGPYVLEKAPYDPIRGFTHVAYIGTAPVVILANPKSGPATLADVVKEAKAKGQLSFGSGGPASIGHIVGEMLKAESGANLVHVPYRGGAPMTTDLVAGLIPVGIDVLTAFVPYIRDGRLRALAVTTRSRSPMAPDVPTVVEAGFPKLLTDNYFGVSGPAGLPAEVVAKMNSAVAEVVAMPDIQRKLSEQGITTGTMTQADFAAFVAKQTKDWEPIVKASGAKL